MDIYIVYKIIEIRLYFLLWERVKNVLLKKKSELSMFLELFKNEIYISDQQLLSLQCNI